MLPPTASDSFVQIKVDPPFSCQTVSAGPSSRRSAHSCKSLGTNSLAGSELQPPPTSPPAMRLAAAGVLFFPVFHSGSPLMLIVCRQSLVESVAALWFICWLLLSCPDQWRKCFDVNELQTISLNTEQGLASQR